MRNFLADCYTQIFAHLHIGKFHMNRTRIFENLGSIQHAPSVQMRGMLLCLLIVLVINSDKYLAETFFDIFNNFVLFICLLE